MAGGGARPGSGRKHTLSDPKALRQFQELLRTQCSLAEVASVLGVDVSNVERWAQEPQYRAMIDKARCEGHSAVRKALFDKAVGGDLGAIIWYGKQYLGQRDRGELKHTGDVRITDGARATLESKLASIAAKHAGSNPAGAGKVN